MKSFYKLLLILLILGGCAVNKQIPSKPNIAAENYFFFAEAAMQQNDINNAIELYEKAIKADSNNVYLKETLMTTLALKAYFDKSAYEQIIETGKPFCDKNIKSEKIFSIMTETYQAELQLENAEKCYKKAIKIQPTMRNLTSYYIFQQNFDPPVNIKLLKKALKHKWEEEKLVLSIAKLFSAVDSVKSHEIYEKAYDKWQDEICLTSLLTSYEKFSSYNKILEAIQLHIDHERDISAPIATYLIGRYFMLEQYDKVLENKVICFKIGTHDILKYLFFSSIKINDIQTGIQAGIALETTGEVPEELKNSFYLYLAELYFIDEQFNKSAISLSNIPNVTTISSFLFSDDFAENAEQKENINKVIVEYSDIQEDKANANYLWGIYYSELDNKEFALTYFNKLTDDYINENDLNFMLAIGYIRNALDVKRARSLLTSMTEIQINPNEFIANLLIGTKNDSLAYSILKEELAANDKPDSTIFISCALIGEKYDTADNLLIILERGIELYPENWELLNAAGYLIADNELDNKYDKAALYLKKAVLLKPEYGMIWDSLAWLYFKQKRYDDALQAMNVPISEDINNSEIAYHIGEIYLSLNKQKKAEHYFKLSIDLNTEIRSVQLSEENLKQLLRR
ncbi:MAG: hypothetical protein P9L97_08970 [Candidatus Tenebribacter davisii]|jgi:tetratricopeptide (TPR) repeat protein|nr:hypothetical protein [Candidatus Tenebribacter davisii]